MKRIIKKYDQYIKENIGDIDDIPSNEEDVNNPVEQEYEMPGDEPIPSEVSDEVDEDGDEEEGHQYKGNQMLSELADKLGTDVVNNSIMYDGKKINFFSETEMYHVDRKKFKTADEVVEYLNSFSNQNDNIAADEESDMMKNDEVLQGREEEELEPAMESKNHKSYRTTRTFEGFKRKL